MILTRIHGKTAVVLVSRIVSYDDRLYSNGDHLIAAMAINSSIYVLTVPFWHLNPRNRMTMEKHDLCFDSIAVITQLKFSLGDSLMYDVHYDVSYE